MEPTVNYGFQMISSQSSFEGSDTVSAQAAHTRTDVVTDKMKVLVVDDERLSSHNLSIQLKFVGETPVVASSENWLEVLELVGAESGLLAIMLGSIKKRDLAELLADVHLERPKLPLLVITQPDRQPPVVPASLKTNLQLLQESDLNYATLSVALLRARELRGFAPLELKSKIITASGSALFRSLSGRSRPIQQIRQVIEQVSKRDVTVLVLGESGTGKEVVARNLHYHSGRGERPFIPVNCAAIAPDRYGVELFGQARGNGVQETSGLLDKAHGSTLYFDEVGELPLNIQTLLLRFIEDRSFQRIGGSESISTDVRIVAGSGKKLEALIQQGKFRPDLYYRLSLMPIELPPLRRRLEDIPELVRELLRSLVSKGYTPISLNVSAVEALQKHSWPGNVRELANLVERLCIMHTEGVIGVKDLPLEYQRAEETEALLEEIEALASKVEETVMGRAVSLERVDVEAATPAPAPNPELAEHVPQVPIAEVPFKEALIKEAPKAEVPRLITAVKVASPAPGSRSDPAAVMLLNDMLLQHHMFNFEKQLLLTALDDCANILSFAAERLNIHEDELTHKIQTYNLESF
jgi:sigma-54 specific flagellar transcriptional regulator A